MEAHHLTTSPPTQVHSPPRSLQSRSSRKRCSVRLTEESPMSSMIKAKTINSKETIRTNSLTINKWAVAKIWIDKCINLMEECSKRTFSSRSVTSKGSNRTRGSNWLHKCQLISTMGTTSTSMANSHNNNSSNKDNHQAKTKAKNQYTWLKSCVNSSWQTTAIGVIVATTRMKLESFLVNICMGQVYVKRQTNVCSVTSFLIIWKFRSLWPKTKNS